MTGALVQAELEEVRVIENMFAKAELNVSSRVLVIMLKAANEGKREAVYFEMAFLSVAHSVLCVCVCV